MTNKLLICFSLMVLSLRAQAPTVSNVTFDGVSHSVVRVVFTASAKFYWLRARFIATPSTCTGGTGGIVQGNSYNASNNVSLHQGVGNTVVVGGLAPNTSYQICPEISSDFVNWSSGAGGTVTTLPVPATHPTLPTPPLTFNSNYPDTTGYANITIAGDCHDFIPQLNSAIANQMANGAVINLPAGQTCTNGPYNVTQRSPDVTVFGSSAVNTSQNSISSPGHGFSEGNGVIFGTTYGCLPGSLTGLASGANCTQYGPLIAGALYYVHVLDANTIQIYSGAPQASGGILCSLPDGGNGTEYFVHWPRPLKWIVIRTSTPDNQFAPVKTRVNPAWGPKMANLQLAPLYKQGVLNRYVLMSVSDSDGHNMGMTANIRFVGVEFSYADAPLSRSSSDPIPWPAMVRVNSYNQSIIFDRCWFHNPGTPSRVFTAIYWDGMDVGIIDSYLDGLEYFKPVYSGLGLTKVN